MDLSFSPEDETFREEVRSFLGEALPARISEKVRNGRRLSKADMEVWHAVLARRGWFAPHWPVDWGGTGWTVAQRFIFEVEIALAHAPRVVPFGVSMLGPVLIRYGSDAQKRRWLPRILDGTDWWCQGFSEPGAGSDLASLRTRAIRDGDVYVVNGQKTWTTLGHFANMIFALVRTSDSGRKQEGVSFLLIDMNTAGVEVRPIRLLDGECEVNEVFFTDVRAPVENLVGEEGQGWTYAKYLLTHERTNIAGVGATMAAFAQLSAIAQSAQLEGRQLIDEPWFARRLAAIEIDLENLKTTNLRMLAAAQHGPPPLVETAMLKIRGTEIRQQITDLARRAAGARARPFQSAALDEGSSGEIIGPPFAVLAAVQYFNMRKLSIFGGSNEIQRDIVGKTLLGL